MKPIGLVSDTHGLLRPEVISGLDGVESILHLGDVGDPAILDRLAEIAPVHAVRGNVDQGAWARALPWTKSLDLFGASAYLIHDVDQLDFDPEAAGIRLVFYGHSHVPKCEQRDGVTWINPGSIGPRRFRLPVSYALLMPDLSVDFVTL